MDRMRLWWEKCLNGFINILDVIVNQQLIPLRSYSPHFDTVAKVFGKFGFATRGFIWICIGVFAIVSATQLQKNRGMNGVLDIVSSHTGGVWLIGVASIGLVGYASWRYFEALYGLRVQPYYGKFKTVVDGYIVPIASGTVYLTIAILNVVHLVQKKHGNKDSINIGDELRENWAGQILLTIVAGVLFGVGVGWLVDLARARFTQDLDASKLGDRDWLKAIVYTSCIFGMIGRTLLFWLLAVLFIRIAWLGHHRAAGFADALDQLDEYPPFRILLGVVGGMLIMFGLWSFFNVFFKLYIPVRAEWLRQRLSNSRWQPSPTEPNGLLPSPFVIPSV